MSWRFFVTYWMQGFIFFFQDTLLPYVQGGSPQGPIPKPFLHTSFWQITVKPLLWDTSIQGTPSFGGHKIWSRKNFHLISVFVTSIEGKTLFRGKYGETPPQGPIPCPLIYHFWQNTVETLLWDISLRTPPFGGHKIWSRKNVYIIFVFVTCILGPENWVSPPFRGHVSNQKVTNHKNRR